VARIKGGLAGNQRPLNFPWAQALRLQRLISAG